MARERIDLLNIAAAETATEAFDPSTYFGQPGKAPPTGAFVPLIRPEEYGPTDHVQTLVDVRYTCNPGHAILTPAAADGAAGQVVKLHGIAWYKEVTWTFERNNEWPVCPHPDSGDPNEVLMPGSWVQPAKPLEGPDGARVYRISGFYIYRLLVPPFSMKQWGPFPTSLGPETTATAQHNTAPAIAFERGMLLRSSGLVPKSY